MKLRQLRLPFPKTRSSSIMMNISLRDRVRSTRLTSNSDEQIDSDLRLAGCWSSRPIIPIFIRVRSRAGTEFWPGLILQFRQVARLISPCEVNQMKPPIRAYALRRQGADHGITLIETSSIARWLNKQRHPSRSGKPLIPEPPIVIPTLLNIPRDDGNCPYTDLKETVIRELFAPRSPYGRTRIETVPICGKTMIETESLLRYIRSIPPPQYKFEPNPYAENS